MSDFNVINLIGAVLGGIVIVAFVFFYLKNIYLLIVSLNKNEYSIKMIIRAFGVFFAVVGVIMGFVQ